MAIAATLITGNRSSTDGTGFTTASGSPTANALQLLAVGSINATTASPPEPSVTGAGLTWVLEEVSHYDTGGSNRASIWLFRAMSASPSSGALTITFTDQTQTNCEWSWMEFTGVDTSGTNGSGAIVQSVPTSGTAAGLTVTLAAFGSADNATYGCFHHQANEDNTEGADFSRGHSTFGASRVASLFTEYKLSNDTSVDASWSTSALAGAIGAEIKAGAAGNTYTKAGGGASALVGSGPDVDEAVETGAGKAALAASAPDVHEAAETGAGIVGLVGSGSDVAESAETGAGIVGLAGSGADVYEVAESGAGVVGPTASGTAATYALLPPVSDASDGTWTTDTGGSDLWGALDEPAAADADYIRSALSPVTADVCEVAMTAGTDPSSSDGHTIRYRYRKDAADGDQIDLTVRLMCGATEIAAWTHTDIAATISEAAQQLSAGQADAITDYADLRVKLEAVVA